MRIWQFLSGYVMIRVEGLSLERFLNLATAEGIGVRRVRRVSYTVLKAEVTARGYRRLVRIVPEKYALTAEKQGGMPFLLRRLTLRTALLIGLAIVAAGLLAASMFVWDVRVDGLEYREAKALKQELAGMGIAPGYWKGGIDEEGAGTALLIAHKEIAWIDIRVEGVVALVKVVSADLAPEVYDENTPQSIIATKDALIESVTPLAGRASVKEGDTVRAGDVLISGLVWDAGYPRMLFAARGEVTGSVWYAGSASASIYTEVRVPTGRTARQRAISIGADSTAIDPDCGFTDYDTRVVDRINIGLFLPVYITEYEHSEVTVKQEPREFKALSVYLEEEAYYGALKAVPEDAQIVSHHAIFKMDDCVMSVAVYIHTNEDIGRAVILEDQGIGDG
jgi:similar to stage IV sporulation protein